MNTINNGGPAFPALGMLGRGMTLRDYFAAKAMQGFMAREGAPDLSYESELAYRMADAMLAAREGKAGGGAA